MSKIDIQKIVKKLAEEKKCPPDFKTAFQAGYAEAATDILTKLAPFLQTFLDEIDHTDLDIGVGLPGEEVIMDGTQFHITLPEEAAEQFGDNIEELRKLLLDEQD